MTKKTWMRTNPSPPDAKAVVSQMAHGSLATGTVVPFFVHSWRAPACVFFCGE